MLADDGRVRVIDLGLAARMAGEISDGAAGTFTYSAPEQKFPGLGAPVFPPLLRLEDLPHLRAIPVAESSPV